jgi:hypothetical protein
MVFFDSIKVRYLMIGLTGPIIAGPASESRLMRLGEG